MADKRGDRTPLNPNSRSPSISSVNDNGNEEIPDYDAIFADDRRRSRFAQKTALGQFRNPKRFSWIEWVFLVVATCSMLAVLALNIERFVTFEKSVVNLTEPDNTTALFQCPEWYCTSDFVFTLLLLINLMFCFFYCYDGLFRERKFELLAFVGATVVITIYVIGNYIFDKVKYNHIHVVKTVSLGLIVILGPVNVTLAALGWWKMGYFVFNVIGSNKRLSNAYHLRSFVTALQYFHLEILANVMVLSFALNGTLLSTAEKVILIFIFFYLTLVVFMGTVSMLWENKIGVAVWYFLLVPLAAYYVYKLVEVSIHWSEYIVQFDVYYDDGQVRSSSMKFVGMALLTAVCLGIVVITLLMISMFFVIRNFNLGLKDKVDPPLKWCVNLLSRSAKN